MTTDKIIVARKPGRPTPGRGRPTILQRGFTLVEVMLALAIVAVALVGIVSQIGANIRATHEAMMRSVVVDLLRSKMLDIEGQLMEEGFRDLDQSSSGDFDDEGWKDISWEAEVAKIEIPGLGALQEQQDAAAEGGEGGSSSSPLANLMAGAGGGLGSDTGAGASFFLQWFQQLTQVLEVSMRKVTVTAKWKVGNEDHEMIVAMYLTDPVAMDKVLLGLGKGDDSAPDGDDSGGGTGTPGAGGSTAPPRGSTGRGSTQGQ